jgi:hypothetical protein
MVETWAVAWIFLAIGDASGASEAAVPLQDLLAAADAANHAIPTLAELVDAVSRLRAAGLVASSGTETRLTPEGIVAHARASEHARLFAPRMQRLTDEWASRGFPPPAPASWALSTAELDAAWQSYTRAFSRAWRAMEADPPA